MGEKKKVKLNTSIAKVKQIRSPEEKSERMTLGLLRGITPLAIRSNLTQEMVNMINTSIDDTEEKELVRENFITWIAVLGMGKFKVKSYVNAVKYVTNKLMGDTNRVSYAKTFPTRYTRLLDRGKSIEQIAGHVSMYNKSLIVTKIIERTLIPVWIYNSDILQEAINTQAELMRFAKSETVRMKAAANLIEHLKQPEAVKVDLSVGVSNDTIEDLRMVTKGLAIEQRRIIQAGGMSARQVAEMEVIKKGLSPDNEAAIEAEFEEMVKHDDKMKRQIKHIEKPLKKMTGGGPEDFYR